MESMEVVRYIGASTYKGKTPLQPAACPKHVLALFLILLFLLSARYANEMYFSKLVACLGQYCSAISKDIFKALESSVHLEQLKKKSIVQMEPDGREEGHSYG